MILHLALLSVESLHRERQRVPCQLSVKASYLQAASSHQQAETRFINKSLNTLNNCLHQLWLNQQKPASSALIPVRDSALTRILSSAMNGRGHLALSVHFSMKEDDLEATRRTLDFAERAAQITVDARHKVWDGA